MAGGQRPSAPIHTRILLEGQSAVYDRDITKAEVYVYEKKGKVLAFVGLQEDYYIAGCFTRNSFRSSGIGRKIIEFLRNKHRILSLRVYEKNERGLRFYEKNGFGIVSINRDVMTGEEEYLMRWGIN